MNKNLSSLKHIPKVDIVFIVHGSKSFGMGHVSRSSKIYNSLKNSFPDINILFLSCVDEPAKEVLVNQGINFIQLKSMNDIKEIQTYIKNINPFIIINDCWENNPPEYYLSLRKFCKKLIVVDDSKHAQDIADLLINISPCKFIPKPKRKDLHLYQGLEYLLLPYNIDSFRYEITGDILIFFGGTDYRDSAMLVAEKLAKKMKDKKFTVIGKPGHKLPKNVRLCLPFSYPITSLLKFHNIIITSGGTAMFESVYFKKPTFAFAAQPWEKDNIAYLEKKSLVKYIGSYENKINDLVQNVHEMLNNPLKFDFHSNNIDGKGLERISNFIVKILKDYAKPTVVAKPSDNKISRL